MTPAVCLWLPPVGPKLCVSYLLHGPASLIFYESGDRSVYWDFIPGIPDSLLTL